VKPYLWSYDNRLNTVFGKHLPKIVLEYSHKNIFIRVSPFGWYHLGRPAPYPSDDTARGWSILRTRNTFSMERGICRIATSLLWPDAWRMHETAIFPLSVWRHHRVPRPRFPSRRGNFGDSAINKRCIAYFSLRMHETAVFPLPV